jgi:leucyl-tRNA synthetase
MDNNNDTEFASRQATDYWNQVDLYIGGTEHAVGHLLYSRMWTKVLHDLGHLGFDEPFKKLLNQGMITGVSQFADQMYLYRDQNTKDETQRLGYYTSEGLLELYEDFYPERKFAGILYSSDFGTKIRTDIIKRMAHHNDHSIVFASAHGYNYETKTWESQSGARIPIEYTEDGVLDIKTYFAEVSNANQYVFVTEKGYYIDGEFHLHKSSPANSSDKFLTRPVVEKMSKSKRNVVNPNDIITKFGADTFRMYEMFLGPIEQSKPWDTKGIEGVHRFLKKLWRLFYDETKGKVWNENEPTPPELKILHRTIKKIEDDTERFSFNTAVSAFMVCVNDLADIKCHKRAILEPVLILLTPYAPHIAEELWHILGNETLVIDAAFPTFEAKYVVESSKEYPVSINGKVRANINLPLDMEQSEVEAIVTSNEVIKKWLEGKAPKKIIFVKGRMINVVI